MNKGQPGVTRDVVIALLKEGPQTTEGMAAKLSLTNQSTWLVVNRLRKDGKPVRIIDLVRPLSGKSRVPLYQYGYGDDVLLDRPQADAPPMAIVPHRDWAVAAMFGARGMANNRMEKRV